MVLVIPVLAGLAVGALLGALGAGGSVVTIPILVHVLGEDVATAATTSLLVVGITATAGALAHARAGSVRAGSALAVGAAAAAGAVAGTFVRSLLPARVFLVLFAGLLIAAAVLLTRPPLRRSGAAVACRLDLRACLRLGGTGLGVGLLTGLFGVGGGFLVVPALTLVLRYPAGEAVGTSLVVVAIASAASLATSFAAAPPDWRVAIPFALAGIVGAGAGRRLSAQLPEAAIRRTFAAGLVLLAAFLVVRNLGPLGA
jgi:uncharacterized protein